MDKNKKVIILLVCVILLLCGVVGFLTYKLSKKDLSSKDDVNVSEEVTCKSDTDINCIYYEESGFKIEKKLGRNQDYYINGKHINNVINVRVKGIIDNKYIIIDDGDADFSDTLYDLNGLPVIFDHPDNVWVDNVEMSFSDNILTIVSFTVIDGYLSDTVYEDFDICTYKPLDYIVYLKQEVEYRDGKFGTPKTIESRTIKDEIEEYGFNIEC